MVGQETRQTIIFQNEVALSNNTIQPMPKQVSALNTFWLIQYLRDHHPNVNLNEIIESINSKSPYYVENLKTGKTELVNLGHLMETDYWFSNPCMIALYEEIQSSIPDPLLAYKMGRTSYKAQPILKTAIGAPLLGPKGMMARIVKENSKYNRTKDNILIKNEDGYAILRLVHHEGIKINKFAMEWHRGVYEAYAKLAGATDIQIQLTCVDFEKAIWDFELKYKKPGLLSRLWKTFIFNIPIVKEAINKAEEIQLEHKEQILNRDRIIAERTQELRDTQAKLVETEKRVLEHRITGGFAHEMRNALTGAQLEMKAVLDYQEKGQAATEVIKEAATNLLQRIKTLQAEYQIPKDLIAQTLIPSIKEIAQVIEFLAGTHQDVYHDLERGLSITSQIRDYAKMAELRPGNDPVDLAALLKGYETRYAKDFGDQKIRYSFSGPDSLILKGDETHFNSIFTNFIINARDALLEIEKDDKQIHVSIETTEKDGNPQIQIKVQDNGPGIPESHLSEIFEPFFSTKPSSGTGLGLGIVKRLVQLYGGNIEVESQERQGACFTVTL
jgi:signal transduction histidine kinase